MKKIVLIVVAILIILGIIGGIIGYKYYNEKPTLELVGEEEITIALEEEYEELGAKARVHKKDISNKITIDSNLDNKKVGKYEVTYTLNYHKKEYTVKRDVNVIDNIKPEIVLTGKEVSIYVGDNYKESGYKATDNYDGDITSNVVVTNNIDNKKKGTYEVKYTVKDSSSNEYEITRKVTVKEKPVTTNQGTGRGVAILMYHNFYDKNVKQTETINDNYMEISNFEAQMKYLHDNNYYFPSWQEIADFVDGKITLPEKSVVVTSDDGHSSFFDLAVPILNKYNIKATSFIITSYPGASKIPEYKSDNIIFQSHTHNMHRGGCSGGHGGLFRCIQHEAGVNDLKQSIAIVGSNDALAYPYGDVTDNVLSITKEVGFKVAVTTKYGKVKKGMDKLQLPRVRMSRNTSLASFKASV